MTPAPAPPAPDSPAAASVVILGGGHNGLAAAAYLARAGVTVTVLERLPRLGGAAVSERPFPDYDARLSRFSYLVSLLPREIINELGLDLELRRRPTASYTPYERDGRARGLLVETEPGEATRHSFRELTGDDRAWGAWETFYADLARLAKIVAPSLLGPLPRAADLAAQVAAVTDGPDLWRAVVEQPLGALLRERFDDDLLRGIVGTDALIGTFASLDEPSLVQNRCFAYHLIGDGTGEWKVPVGGMGSVTGALEAAARHAGATLLTETEVTTVHAHDHGVTVTAATPTGPVVVEADFALANIAPHTLHRLRGLEATTAPPPAAGAQVKVNVLVSRLPRLRSGDDPAVAFAGTFHVDEAMSRLEELHRAATGGQLPFASGELYCHTLTDRSILGPELAASPAQTLTWFGLHAHHDALLGPGAAEHAYREVVRALEAHLAEPLEPLVLGVEVKTPADLEAELGLPGGHIFHGDLDWPWLGDDEEAATPAARWGVATDHDRVLLCGSGARRGGAVSAIAGRDAAHALAEILDLNLHA